MKIKDRFFTVWVLAFVSLAVNIVTIITFGFYTPNWEMDYAVWRVYNIK